MNIFYLDPSADLCAQYHTDKHVVKMILEYAQLLSTAHRVLDGKEWIELSSSGRKQKVYKLLDGTFDFHLYKATHINHPSARWVRNSFHNYNFLFELWVNLLNEYTHRYGKVHKSARLLDLLSYTPERINDTTEFSEPWRAMPDEYKISRCIDDYTVKSYRAYYNGDKSHLFNWKSRDVPYWVELKENNECCN